MPSESDEQLITNYLGGDEKSLEILIKRYLKPIYSFTFRFVGNGQEAEDITQEVFVKVWRNLKKFDPQRSRSPKESLRLPTGQVATLRGRQNKKPAPHPRLNFEEILAGGSGFKTWIFTITKNTCFDWRKKKRTIPFSVLDNKEEGFSFAETIKDPAPLPNELLEKQDIVRTLNKALEILSPKYRTVLFLRYNDHFTPLEVRSANGGTASAIGGLPLTGFTFREIAESLGESLNTIKSRHRRALIMLKKLLTGRIQ